VPLLKKSSTGINDQDDDGLLMLLVLPEEKFGVEEFLIVYLFQSNITIIHCDAVLLDRFLVPSECQ
jgi:hypothetical protein